MTRKLHLTLAGGAVAVLLALAPAAMAAGEQGGTQGNNTSGTPGVTSGPAAGSDVLPSTAVQKGQNANSGLKSQATAGAVAAGAPGVAGKPSTEAGPAPSHKKHHHSGQGTGSNR